MMIQRTVASFGSHFSWLSIRQRLSGVVSSRWGGWFNWRWRSVVLVSPERRPIRIGLVSP